MSPERFQKIKKILSYRQHDITIVMDNVHKPHNLAAIARSCDAVGIASIHGITKNNQKIDLDLKSASGSNHWVKLHQHKSPRKLLSSLKQKGFTTYAAHKSDKSINFRNVNFNNPTAIIFGSELAGISDKVLKLADKEINIPMYGMVESLNVSVACAIILYEIQRQRHKAKLYNKKDFEKKEFENYLFELCYPKIAKIYKDSGEDYPKLNKLGQIK